MRVTATHAHSQTLTIKDAKDILEALKAVDMHVLGLRAAKKAVTDVELFHNSPLDEWVAHITWKDS